MADFLPIKVEHIASTEDAEFHIERCGREAYGSVSKGAIDSCREWIQKRIAQGEEDVLEHASATFRITCSIVAARQFHRHRLGAVTERSQRFSESATKNYVIPVELADSDVAEWANDAGVFFSLYEKWRSRYPRQTARYMLPLMTQTSFYTTRNFRDWRHVLKMRIGEEAQPEIQFIARDILAICNRYWPGCFGDIA